MTDYLGEGWQPLLSKNNLATYASLWELKADWFEEPNIRRGGWSGVVKVTLKQTNDVPVSIFIKRQENHLSRTGQSCCERRRRFHSSSFGIQNLWR